MNLHLKILQKIIKNLPNLEIKISMGATRRSMGEILGPPVDPHEGQLADQQGDHSLITTLITMDGLHSQDKLHTLTTLIVSSHQEILEEETATSL